MGKKIISILIVFALLSGMWATRVYAQEAEADYKGRFIFSSDIEHPLPGDTVTVTFSVQNNYPVSVISVVAGYDSNYYEIVNEGTKAFDVLGDWPVYLIGVTRNPDGMYSPVYTEEMKAQYSQLYMSITWLYSLAVAQGDTSTVSFRKITPVLSFQLKVKEDAPTDGKGLIWMDPVYKKVPNTRLVNTTKMTRGGNDVGEGELASYGQTFSFSEACLYGDPGVYDCLHIDADWSVKKKPGCTEDGMMQEYCNDCHTYCSEKSIAATGHEWSKWIISRVPTEEVKGEKYRTCSICNEKETEEIDLFEHVHDDGTWQVVTPVSCTADGYRELICNGCGMVLDTQVIQSTGHVRGEWEVSAEPTCTHKGAKIVKCTVCSAVLETAEISATGHSWSPWSVTKEATEFEEGLEERFCYSCNKHEQNKIEKLEHVHVRGAWQLVKEAECTANGSEEVRCTGCGEILETRILLATGHTEGEWAVTEPATCTNDGIQEKRCIKCGTQLSTAVISSLGHDMNHGVQTKAASCTEDGVMLYTCQRAGCDYSYTEPIHASGHNAGEWTVVEPASCTDDGIQEKCCIKCGTQLSTAVISSLGHDMNHGVQTTAASCTEDGVMLYSCQRAGCDYSYTESIRAAGHSAGEWIVSNEATCTQSGISVKKCTVCDEILETKTLEPLNHAFDDGTVTVEPKCEKKGLIEYKCKNKGCKVSYTEELDALQHEWSEYQFIMPNCTQDGYAVRTCSRCKMEDSYITEPATGHKAGEWTVLKPATETSIGVREIHCSECGELLESEIYAIPVELIAEGLPEYAVVGGPFQKEDMHIIARFCDNSTADVTDEIEISKFNTEREGNITAAIAYTCNGATVYKEFDLFVYNAVGELSGDVSVSGQACYGSELSVDISKLEPSVYAAYNCVWRAGTEIVGTDSVYTVKEEDIGKKITVTITGTGLFYGSLRSAGALAEKALNHSVPPVPELVSVTPSCVEVEKIENAQYRYAGGEWQDEPLFTGLAANTEYLIYVRYAENACYTAGLESEALKVTTSRQTLSGLAQIRGYALMGHTLGVDFADLNCDRAALKYQWYSGDIKVGTQSTYEVTELDIGQEIYVVVTAADYLGKIESDKVQACSIAPQDILIPKSGTKVVVDNEKMLIYGLNENYGVIQDYLDTYNSFYTMEVVPAENGNGTGALLKVKLEDETLITYTIAIFGDLNGDAVVDSFDQAILSAIANSEIQAESSTAIFFVSDLNFDGVVDVFDEAMIIAAANYELQLSH